MQQGSDHGNGDTPERPSRGGFAEPGSLSRPGPARTRPGGPPWRGPLDESELDLRGYLRILRRRLWVILLVPALTTGVAVATASRQTPLYRSSADILLARNQVEALFNPLTGSVIDPSRFLADQIRVVRSLQVTELVKTKLGSIPAIKASGSSTEDVITLSAIDRDPKRAADVVNAYSDAYLTYRRSSGASQNATAQAELKRQLDATQALLSALDQAVVALPAAGPTPTSPSPRDQLRAAQAGQRAPLESQQSDQRGQLSKLQAAAAVDQGGAQLLAPATVPHTPFAPKPIRSGVLGGVVGLMLGVGLVFLLDYLDNRIRGKEDLERATGNLPVIGMIPSLPDWRKPEVARIISIEEPTSGSAEAYRGLRTSIQFLGLDRSVRTLQVSSPATSEGKTTTLVNLAVALSRAGLRVVVIDCDLRRPRVHQFFGMDPNVGFTSVLLGEVPLQQTIRPVPELPGLMVIPAGPVPPNPSELLSGRRTVDIFNALQEQADFVLVDSPPVLPVSDAAVIASRVDATLMVVSDNKTHRKQLARALELLRQVDGVVIGTVLNRMTASTDGYGYGYRYQAKPVTKSAENGRPATKSEVSETDGIGRNPE